MLPCFTIPFSILGALKSSEGSCLRLSVRILFAKSITVCGFLRFCFFTISVTFFNLIYSFKSPIPLLYMACIESPKKPIIHLFTLSPLGKKSSKIFTTSENVS